MAEAGHRTRRPCRHHKRLLLGLLARHLGLLTRRLLGRRTRRVVRLARRFCRRFCCLCARRLGLLTRHLGLLTRHLGLLTRLPFTRLAHLPHLACPRRSSDLSRLRCCPFSLQYLSE